MTVYVDIDLDRNFNVNADIDTVFALLSDVPASASHFPKVESLTPLADDIYRWDMEKISLGIHSIQTSYVCQYISDLQAKTVTWIPIEGEGNAIVSGKWVLSELDNGTEIYFQTTAQLSLPLLGFLQLAVSPLVQVEFTQMVETYLQNLKNLWD